jgi:hypothetical protein
VKAVPNAWTVTPPAGWNIARATLRYRLASAVQSTPGSSRALLLVAPLGATVAPDLPVHARVDRATVLQAACPTAPTARQLCGMRSGDGWVAELPLQARPALIAFQVDLSRSTPTS